MTTTSANLPGESLAALPTLGHRRELLQALSEQSTLGTPVVDALEQGENLPQASAKDEAPCGVCWSVVSAWAGRAA